MKLRNLVKCLIAIGVASIVFPTLANGLGAIEAAPGGTVEPAGLLVLGFALTATGLLVRVRQSS